MDPHIEGKTNEIEEILHLSKSNEKLSNEWWVTSDERWNLSDGNWEIETDSKGHRFVYPLTQKTQIIPQKEKIPVKIDNQDNLVQKKRFFEIVINKNCWIRT